VDNGILKGVAMRRELLNFYVIPSRDLDEGDTRKLFQLVSLMDIKQPVADFMKSEPLTVEHDCKVSRLAQLMMENDFFSFPVVRIKRNFLRLERAGNYSQAVERHDMYNQVNQCGINIIVGGTNYYSDPLSTILNAADANNIQLIVNNATSNSYIYTYSNSYRMQYESTGYQSNQNHPRLVTIEGQFLYDFNHEVGEFDPDDDAVDNEAWRVDAPGTTVQ
jgi:hypothetical protein